MKKIVVLLFAVVLFNCGGADSTDDGTDSTDIVENDAGSDAEDPEFTDGDTDVGADSTDENTDSADGADVGEEADVAPDVEDPLEEYLFLVAKWKCAEYDNGPCPGEIIVDITIGSWDDALGAEVYTFPPYGPPHPYLRFKKNAETGQFEAINPETKQVVGYGTTTKVEYDSSIEVGVTHHAVWAKIE